MNPPRHLKRLHLQSPQPSAMAHFYQQTFGMTCLEVDGTWRCSNKGREVLISEGQAGQLHYALFEFENAADWTLFTQQIRHMQQVNLKAFSELPQQAVGFRDPDGNCMVFAQASDLAQSLGNSRLKSKQNTLPPAESQHFALRTQQVDTMKRFYTQDLGFILSDVVKDDQGDIKACFVRGNEMHHTLALFGAPVTCFDHQSFETPDWNALKDWADYMGQLRVEIVWGVGRHGPGNDVFFMVRDPDGNLAEISSEIEICAESRPVGQWKHEERTLNLWGKAIMRS
jgi:catechol 2,3-dioxygenase